MSEHVLVVKTEEPDLYEVLIADMDDHRLAGDGKERLGRYPLDVANTVAIETGRRRGLPVIVASP